MQRRLIIFISFVTILSVTGCGISLPNGYSIDYAIQRARVRLTKPDVATPAPVFTTAPFPTKLVKLGTPTWEQATAKFESPTPYPTSVFEHAVMLPVASLQGKSPEEIGRQLFSAWLAFFKTDAASELVRVKDYRIEQVYLEPSFQTCIEGTKIEAIPTIKFAVLLFKPQMEWIAGSGEFEKDGWLSKIESIAVYRIGDQYTFSLLGAPPCSLKNRQGASVP